ncbi:MAG TPA: 50S ribosomal protein L2 [Planctomycetota bacterium]|jgi:large subunit ribosomal protein L2|nr:50S ribosomal protein L2 [Planctomycetota bacterium]
MAIRRFKPTSPGRRHGSVVIYRDILTGHAPEKSLLEALPSKAGRNNHGHITTRHQGGGAKRAYRQIDFRREKDGIKAKVASIEYDPNRTSFIALLHYVDGEKRYILAPEGLRAGTFVESGEHVEPIVGNAMPLSHVPLGMEVHNVELRAGAGGRLGRSAGSAIRLVAREDDLATLLMPSGEMRRVPMTCRCTIGTVGNADHQHVKLGKAGRKRHLGVRPNVRGSAMNPIAHPMGGGEGRRSGGRHPVSPWGKFSKGGKTRSRKKASSKFIVRGRKKR